MKIMQKIRYLENDAFWEILSEEKDVYSLTNNIVIPVCTLPM